MTDHTPGPWIMSGGRTHMDGEQFHTVGPDASGWIAAVIYSDLTTELHRQSLADARLIAAAPDLLAALKGLMEIINESRGVDGWHLNGNIAAWGEFEEPQIADEAIQKAEGKS